LLCVINIFNEFRFIYKNNDYQEPYKEDLTFDWVKLEATKQVQPY